MRGDKLVKGKQFNSWRSVGNVMQAAEIYAYRAVDEIILLDIDATPNGRGPDFKQIERVAAKFFTPLTVGGGVRSVQDVRDLLSAGADKVAFGTAQFPVPSLVQACADKFGSQAIVVAVDVKAGHVMKKCGTQIADPTYLCECSQGDPVGAVDWAREIVQWGTGEILLTSIDREGTMEGYDIELIRAVSAAVDVPVIAHGGCSGYEDMAAAIRAGASGVAAGALFQFTDATPREAAQYLAARGIEARV